MLTVVAFFAILVTGRYPRGIFDFNVGVLRWTWRVAFYSYGALGTDRYPPFTLDDAPDYPARLHVEYPESLSRGLVLVKWWLLAIPHYIIVGIFLGGGSYAASRVDGWFWSVRVPDRPDRDSRAGRRDRPRVHRQLSEGDLRLRARARPLGRARRGLRAPDARRVPAVPARSGWSRGEPRAVRKASRTRSWSTDGCSSEPAERGTAGRVVLIVVGIVAGIIAFGLLAGGCALVAVDQTQRDDDGFLMSPTEDFSSPTYAIVSESADLDTEGAEWALDTFLGTVRIRSESDRAVFVGIAPAAEVDRYLEGVEHDVVDRLRRRCGVRARGPAALQPPRQETRRSGPNRSSVRASRRSTGSPRTATWRVVLMNADGRVACRPT